jgi:hypothetical protein
MDHYRCVWKSMSFIAHLLICLNACGHYRCTSSSANQNGAVCLQESSSGYLCTEIIWHAEWVWGRSDTRRVRTNQSYQMQEEYLNVILEKAWLGATSHACHYLPLRNPNPLWPPLNTTAATALDPIAWKRHTAPKWSMSLLIRVNYYNQKSNCYVIVCSISLLRSFKTH